MENTIAYIEKQLKEFDSNYEQVRILYVKSKAKTKTTDSIVISSPMTLYRPKIDRALIAKVKPNGKIRYVNFREKYKQWFDNNNIKIDDSIKSEQGFFRVTLDDFYSIINNCTSNGFIELFAQMCLDAMSFPKFGCCDKFEKCSDERKCLHKDLLYSTACMYRKNLENNRIFYGKNKNV